MNVKGLTPILNVSSVPDSMRWFMQLGWTVGFAWDGDAMLDIHADHSLVDRARFGSVCSGETQIFLCKDGQGLRGGKPARFDGENDTGATWMSWWLGSPAEVDAAHQLAVSHGVTVLWPPTDEPWGVRECRIMHPDGHVFRLGAGLD
ncbi:VOC family protein [Burkholderiaceae bacterium UC74_6]